MIKILIAQKILTDTATFIDQVNSLPFGNAEKQRLLNINNVNTSRASLSAYLALSRLLENSSDNLTISRNANGKPFFEHHKEIPFSISHSGELSATAICYDYDNNIQSIGIDIEFKKGNIKFKDITNRFFRNEKASIQSEDDFLILWTKKEAFSKMRGGALTDVLTQTPQITECYKIKFNDKTAYMSVCCEIKQEIEILTDSNKISIIKT